MKVKNMGIQDKNGRRLKANTMTEGPIGKEIILFAIPLLLGNLFQQLYSAVDSLIVGRVVGKEALAAVGSSGAIINLLVSFLMGITLGSTVVIAKYYGAENDEKVGTAVHTSIILGILAGLILSITGILLTPQILRWMGTPSDVMGQSVIYLRIIFIGMLPMVLYNVGSSIFRAVGNSRTPLYYLIISSMLNIGLDLLFVVVLDTGIAGAATATIAAQTISCILTFAKLGRDKESYQFHWSKLRMNRDDAKEIIDVGLPSGIQNSVVALSNVVVQSNINAFGSAAMAGCGAYVRLDGFAVMPAISFGMALTTFVGQNRGAKKPERIKAGARFGILAAMITVELAGVLLFIFAPVLIRMFQNDSEVVAYGVAMARTSALFYIFLAAAHSSAGALRGAGLTKVPMFVMLACWCVMRVAWITIMIQFINDIRVVFWGYPITWVASCIIFAIYYKRSKWIEKCMR